MLDGGAAETFESFDNFDDVNVDAEANSAKEDDWSGDEPEIKQQDEAIKVLDDSQADSEGKVIKDKEEKPKKEDKPAKKEDKEEDEDESDEDEEEESDEPKAPEDQKPEGKKSDKKLRIRMGDGELYNIDSDSTFRVKVDGQNVDVTAQELINNYAGKTAWDKKFTEIGKEKKELQFEKSQVEKQKNTLQHHLQQVIEPLKDPNKNPLDSLLYLVEMTGQDPYTAYRRIMEANLDELGNLYDMSEVERDLYFHKKKDELYSSVNKKRQERLQQEQTFNQVLEKVDGLRKSYNVSEDEFVDASEELESIYENSGLDVNSITDEAIVDYASLKPHIAKVKELVEPYQDNIDESKYGDVVSQLSRYLRDGKANEKQVAEILKRNFSVEEEVKDLNTKVYQKNAKNGAKKVALKESQSNSAETFDDWN